MIRTVLYSTLIVIAILLGIQGFLMIGKINRQVISACQLIDSTITTMDECEIQRDSLKTKAREMFTAEWDTLTAKAGSITVRVGSTAVRIEGLVRRWADSVKVQP